MKLKSERHTASILEKYNSQFEYAEALMLFLIAFQYFQLWVSPDSDSASKIFQLAGLIAFEFIMVHSGVFMSVMPKKISLYVLVPVYGLFALAFNQIIGGNAILVIYLITIFNRMRFAFFNVNEVLKSSLMLKSIIAVSIYFVLILVVAFSSNILPQMGLSAENLRAINYEEAKKHGGLFLDQPHTSMCMGFLYYAFLGLISIRLSRRTKP